MSSIFNIKRFGWLLKRKLANDMMQYIYIASGLTGLYVILVVAYSISGSDFSWLLFLVQCLLVIISPCLFERNTDNASMIFDFEVPASAFEKFAALWLKYVLLIPFITVGVCLLLSLFHQEIISDSFSLFSEFTGNFWRRMYTLLALQSVFMTGYLYFRSFSLVKTIMVIAFFTVLYSILSKIIFATMMPDIVAMGSISHNWGEAIVIINSNRGEIVNVNMGNTLNMIKDVLSIIYPFGMWLVCFLRIREREI